MKNLFLFLTFNVLFVNCYSQEKYIKKIDELAIMCRTGNEKACSKIKQYALEGDEFSRVYAIRKVTDQTFLKNLAVHDENLHIKLVATFNLIDTSFVFGVLKNTDYNTLYTCLCSEVEFVANQSILKYLTNRFFGTEELMKVIVANLNDQEVLKEIATNNTFDKIREVAKKKLTDTTLFSLHNDFFKNNPKLKTKLIQWEEESPDSIKILINIIRKGSALSKARAAQKLEKMKENAKGAIIALMEILSDETELVYMPYGTNTSPSMVAMRVLESIGKPAYEPLCYALNNESLIVRRNASDVLHSDEYYSQTTELESSSKKILIDAYKENKDLEIHTNLALPLCSLKDTIAVKLLIDALGDNYGKRPGIRSQIIERLGASKEHKFWSPLLHIVNDKNDPDRLVAIQAIGSLKDTEAVETLISILDEGFNPVEVNKALQEITGEKFWGKDWNIWWDTQKSKNKNIYQKK
jgi:HEAT repeat protein